MNERLDRERERIEALKRLQLMDTAPEERFERICRVASQLLQTPIAYVSLLDDERQFFKAAVGLGGVRETPREGTFCTHTIQGEKPLYVPDATSDDRFRESPYVQGPPNVRCYLGEPLFSADGFAVGTFCILDMQPRQLDEQQRQTFRDLADLAERELNLLAQLHQQRKLTELTSHLVSSLDQAEIAQTLLNTLQETIHLDRAAVAVKEGDHFRLVSSTGERPKDNALTVTSAQERCFSDPATHALCLPILHHDRQLGILWLERLKDLSFTPLETEMVASFVVQAGLILENRDILVNLFEQSRLASLGSLAAGVAHEINSPLGAAKLGIESAQRFLSEDDVKIQRKLARANEAIERAGKIIETVLQYAGEGPNLSARSDLNSVARRTLALLNHDLKSHQIEVAEDLQAEGSVPLSPDLLQTVIHHLLKNSLWALTRPDVPNRLLTVRSGSLGEKLFLDVEDSGIGVSQELQSRIFDPFFTTHRPGEGVGLGLSVSRKTAREAGGDLLCCNVQKGALFRLTLPLHKE